MLFSSVHFLTVFLPLTLVCAWLVSRTAGPRAALAGLVCASFIFYSWFYPPYSLLLVFTISLNYVFGKQLERRKDKALLTLAILSNVALLGWYKYAGFLGEMVETLFGLNTHLPGILLPLGISFFTFQQIAYLVDIYDRKARSGSFLDYVFLISFFPQLIAGPIVHHGQLIPQLSQPRFARFRSEDIAAGSILFSLGLAKKTLLADPLAVGADTLFAAESLGLALSVTEAWLGMLSYSFQIYFDFSGYSDMALGLGLLFGLTLPINFQSPYKSASIIEFWRRWNMTLSTFLRDYIYFPLGGNRRGKIRRYANLWAVMLVGGLWHGAGLTFIVWGALHGLYLTIAHLWERHRPWAMPMPLASALTFLAVVIAWVFFRSQDFGQAFAILQTLFPIGGDPTWEIDIYETPDLLGLKLLCGALLVWGLPNALELTQSAFVPGVGPRRAQALGGGAGLLLALSFFFIYTSGSNAFIYFQF